MIKRSDEKFTILSKLCSYNIRLDVLESLYFKRVHKKHQIVLWIEYKSKKSNIVTANQYHEIRTEKDIIRYITSLCDKLKKKYRPLEDTRKVCIATFKGDEIMTLSAPQLGEVIKSQIESLQSIHFFTESSMQDQQFTHYQFMLRSDEDRSVACQAMSLSKEQGQKLGKGAGINNLIRGYGLDQNEHDYHVVQITQTQDRHTQIIDVNNTSTMRQKLYNYVFNLLYILDKRDNISIERMNLYFILDKDNRIFLFDIDKVLITEARKPKTRKDENYFIDCLKPEVSLIPPTFKEHLTEKKTYDESESDKKKLKKKLQESSPQKESFILKNIKKVRKLGHSYSQTQQEFQIPTINHVKHFSHNPSSFKTATEVYKIKLNEDKQSTNRITHQKQQSQDFVVTKKLERPQTSKSNSGIGLKKLMFLEKDRIKRYQNGIDEGDNGFKKQMNSIIKRYYKNQIQWS